MFTSSPCATRFGSDQLIPVAESTTDVFLSKNTQKNIFSGQPGRLHVICVHPGGPASFFYSSIDIIVIIVVLFSEDKTSC